MSAAQGYEQFSGLWQKNAQLMWDAINRVPSRGIPNSGLNVMEWSVLEKLSGHEPGSYPRDPGRVYMDFQLAVGACYLSQWIPENPLTMTDTGFDAGTEHGAATGAERIVVDGITIDSPEAVVEHLERFVFPDLVTRTRAFAANADAKVRELIVGEVAVQRFFGMNILKGPYGDGFQAFPYFEYSRYGYVNYFAAYALYPEVIERHFRLQGDYAVLSNTISARAMVEGGLPRMLLLDHDMADSRGTLVDVRSLDRIWFPHFCRSIEPFLRAGIALLWHCDGNLMEMVPRLIAAGLQGFQGFQYEAGMDYERICRMKDRDGRDLCIFGGVSVTRTLPFGTPGDVKREMKWLVDNGPRTGLFLAASSSITPRTPIANIKTLVDGFAYYREHGRGK